MHTDLFSLSGQAAVTMGATIRSRELQPAQEATKVHQVLQVFIPRKSSRRVKDPQAQGRANPAQPQRV